MSVYTQRLAQIQRIHVFPLSRETTAVRNLDGERGEALLIS